MTDLLDLPGAELVRRGIDDLAAGRRTIEALVVSIASIRLRQLALPIPTRRVSSEPELDLYDELRRAPDVEDGYGRYNSLLRELDSFIEGLERRRRRPR